MASQWFYEARGKGFGPVSNDELRNLVQRGIISTQTRVANNPNGPWVAAGRIKGLFPEALGTVGQVPAKNSASVMPQSVEAREEPPGLAPAARNVLFLAGGYAS